MRMLEIKNLHVDGRRQGDPQGPRPRRSARAKCMRSWGRTARARARWPMCWPGREGYEVTDGRGALSRAATCWRLAPEERAREGVFLAFQYPVEIPGVANMYFLRAALNALRRHRGEPELDAVRVPEAGARRSAKLLGIDEDMLQARRQCRLLRRREEAQRDPPDGDARAAPRDPRRDRSAASTSTRCGSSPTASTRCAARSGRSW